MPLQGVLQAPNAQLAPSHTTARAARGDARLAAAAGGGAASSRGLTAAPAAQHGAAGARANLTGSGAGGAGAGKSPAAAASKKRSAPAATEPPAPRCQPAGGGKAPRAPQPSRAAGGAAGGAAETARTARPQRCSAATSQKLSDKDEALYKKLCSGTVESLVDGTAVISFRKISELYAKLYELDKVELLSCVQRAAALGRSSNREWRDDYTALLKNCNKLSA